MKVRDILRSCFVLPAVISLTTGFGCGGTPPEGNLPPEKPATAEELKAAEDQMKEAMKNMGKPK